MTDVRENCRRILDKIETAAVRSGRSPGSIRLIAVTKTVPAEKIREAVGAGIADIGENRLQEALSKREALRDLPLTWHFIGHLQTNKAKKVAEHFDWVQCVDRQELAEKLNQTATKPLPVLIEVNIGGEPAKSGIHPGHLQAFIDDFTKYEGLRLTGLMAIPPFFEDPEHVRLLREHDPAEIERPRPEHDRDQHEALARDPRKRCPSGRSDRGGHAPQQGDLTTRRPQRKLAAKDM